MRHMMLIYIVLLFQTAFCQDIIKIEFSEPMDSTDLFNCNNYVITSQEPYLICLTVPPVKCIFKPSEIGYDSLTYVYMLTDNHIPGEYMLEVFNVSDLAGNTVNLQYNYAYYGGSAGANPKDKRGK